MLERVGSKLEVAFFLATFTEEYGIRTTMEALDGLAFEIRYQSVLHIQVCIDTTFYDQLVDVVRSLDRCSASIARKRGCGLLPKVRLVILLDLEEDLFLRLDKFTA